MANHLESVTLTIDNESVTVPVGTTILQAARLLEKDIPTICYHENCTSNAICRSCVVEVVGGRVLVAACVTPVTPGMIVYTRSERVERARRTVFELLDSAVDLSEAPEIQQMLADYQADSQRFPQSEQRTLPLLDDNPMFVRDYAKCVLCWRCVQVCGADAQYAYAINFSGRGFHTQIGTFYNQPLPLTTCVFCGQCIGVCPTNALKPKREWLLEQGESLESVLAAVRGPRRRGEQ